MSTPARGVMIPPSITLHLSSVAVTVPPILATIRTVEQFAGAAIGSAAISYEAHRASDVTRNIGDRARISAGGDTIFSGAIGHAPLAVGQGEDDVELILFDDKWLINSRVIGQIGIGTQGDPVGLLGFKDVGFDLIFNKDGGPNKDPATLDFNTGSTAVQWTLTDILNLIFSKYISPTIATLNLAEINRAAWLRKPTHLNLTGNRVLQALDAVTELAGESWTLQPGPVVSTFKSVRAGAGTIRTARVFSPYGGASVLAAGESHAGDIKVALSIENCRDKWQAVSSPILLESVYSKANELLARQTTFKDPEYAARFAVDVTKYSANGLGNDLSVGSKPKAWKKDLVSRMKTDGSGYLEKADLDANPALATNQTIEIPVWISATGNVAGMKLVSGGIRIDTENGTVDFEKSVQVAGDTFGAAPTSLAITDWATAGVWITVATVLREVQTAITTDDDLYLSEPSVEVIPKTDLVPERRYKSLLPSLAGTNPNTYLTIAADAEEKYIDVTDRLQDVVDSARSTSQEIETPIDVVMEMFPIWQIGDQLRISGRNLGQTGNEVIVSLRYELHGSYKTIVHATNLVKGIKADVFTRQRNAHQPKQKASLNAAKRAKSAGMVAS